MAQYLVNRNAQANGDHEVHTTTCPYVPALHNRLDLGYHLSCYTAVQQARLTFRQSNGCRWCSLLCHTQ